MTKSFAIFPPDENKGFKSDVYLFGFFLYSMFLGADEVKDIFPKVSTDFKLNEFILDTSKLPKIDFIPDHYWDLINKCWKNKPEERPTFEEITEILKNDTFALDEFGVKTDLNELHEYQKRIESE